MAGLKGTSKHNGNSRLYVSAPSSTDSPLRRAIIVNRSLTVGYNPTGPLRGAGYVLAEPAHFSAKEEKQ